jgi:hypothetical protein
MTGFAGLSAKIADELCMQMVADYGIRLHLVRAGSSAYIHALTHTLTRTALLLAADID